METQALELAHQVDFSFWALFLRATLTVKIVMLLLILASFGHGRSYFNVTSNTVAPAKKRRSLIARFGQANRWTCYTKNWAVHPKAIRQVSLSRA